MMTQARGVAVVSGGGSGIGREIALELARRGHSLALLGRRPLALQQTLDLAGGEGIAVECDVRDPAAVERAVREVESRWGAADVVVPAAGVAHIHPTEELTPEQFQETLATNLTGAFLVIRAFLPGMRRRGKGWIFPVLSVAARRGFPGWGAYCASKWGLAGFVAALREELQGSGIRITCLYPGATDTPLWEGVGGDWDRGKMVPAGEAARAVGYALDAPASTLVEEVHFGPAGGAL